MRAFDSAVRQGNIEGMHRMRASTRRLRSELKLFQDQIDEEWGLPLEDDLKWLASKLGVVRQLDVLRDRIRSQAGPLEESLGPIFEALGSRRSKAALELQCVLDGERYEEIVHRLEAVVAYPSFEDDASETCRNLLPDLLSATWKPLKKRARRLEDESPDEDFHEVRKYAKRMRYASEAVAGALPDSLAEEAKRFTERCVEVQDVLGEHQDAADCIRFVEEIASEHPSEGTFSLAAGRILERESQTVMRHRQRFFEIWSQFDRKRNRRWFHV